MEIILTLGGLRFRFLSERVLILTPELRPFLSQDAETADVTVQVSWAWVPEALPTTPPVGEDAICRYFERNGTLFCLTRGGPKGYIACTTYGRDYRAFRCTLNEAPFLEPPNTLASVLRFLPMRAIFQHFGVLFLHASQISLAGKGILFTAPSGTGKSTQARLWQRHRGTEIVCADRTLLRRVGGGWRTYGYPLDGSEPVRSDKVLPLGCVVLLEQGEGNSVHRLRPSQAAAALMEQSVIDGWSAAARTAAMELILALLEDVPVYRLTCTPDEGAVKALEAKLMEDEVIRRGRDL